MSIKINFFNNDFAVHIGSLPNPIIGSLFFGHNPGFQRQNDLINPMLKITVKFQVKMPNTGSTVDVATYSCHYGFKRGEVGDEITGRDVYECILQLVHGLRTFLRVDPLGRTIPEEMLATPPREVFQDDLDTVAQALNKYLPS